MDFSNIFVKIFLFGTAAAFILDLILEYIDFSFRKRHGKEIPEEIKDYVDCETLKKTCLYEDAQYKLWIPETIVTTILEVYLVVCGFYPALFSQVESWTESPLLQAFLFAVLSGVPVFILALPFSLYSEFGIEKQFGFSKMTMGLWIVDRIKSIIVSFVVSFPLLVIMIFLFKHVENLWWLLLACVYVGFSLIISVIYPLFIAPIFNKFTPLEDGELKERLEKLLEKCGFKANGLFVMDASKRSGHSNAYFTGFGKAKRVVLYDTLISQLSVDEIESVLGHELGHYKKHHIAKRLIVMIPLVFAVLFTVSLFISDSYLYEGFGFSVGQRVPVNMMFIGLFLLSLVFEEYSIFSTLVSNFFTRKDEYQADAFSVKVCGTGEPLISALIKLNKENLSEISSPKIYSAFNDSHPQLLDRINAIRQAEKL